MGEFAFNEDFGVMKSGKWHFVVTQQRSALALLGSFNRSGHLDYPAGTCIPSLLLASEGPDWHDSIL